MAHILKHIETRNEYINTLIKARNKARKSDDLTEVIKEVNEVCKMHLQWLKIVNEAIKQKDFSYINKMDWNDFYHDFEDTIKRVYFEIKDKYHSLHWDKYQYNAYNF
jgi:hypothetical protein